jgi:hypothetical protein
MTLADTEIAFYWWHLYAVRVNLDSCRYRLGGISCLKLRRDVFHDVAGISSAPRNFPRLILGIWGTIVTMPGRAPSRKKDSSSVETPVSLWEIQSV